MLSGLPNQIPIEKIKVITRILGVPDEDFNMLTRIEIGTRDVFIAWEDLQEIAHTHRIVITPSSAGG